MKPMLITPGDAAGIGPEVALKAARDLRGEFPLAFVGPAWLWQQAAQHFTLPAPHDYQAVPALDDIIPERIAYGQLSPLWGRVAMECVRAAAEACLAGAAAAMVTAPLTKAGIHAAGYNYQGHTDFIAGVTRAPRHAMMLSSGPLRVLLVTVHQSLRSVPDALSASAILDTIELAHETGRRLRIAQPRIAVCALNPHAGEAGAFGTEEEHIIAPAIRAAQQRHLNASGPHPADTIFAAAVRGRYDFVVAMYHDQGLIPVKLFGFEQGVNTTVGLPIVRTSPDHGTAYDIAGANSADPSSMIAAIRMAAGLAASS